MTRIKTKDVDSNSTWANGFQRMALDCKNFPSQTTHEIKLNQQEEIASIKNKIQGKRT